MTRVARSRARGLAVLLSLASIVGCEGEDAICGAACDPTSFAATVQFDPGAASQIRWELCRKSECTVGVGPAHSSFGVRSGGPGVDNVGFGVEIADAGPAIAHVFIVFEDDSKLADGDLYRLTITDADSNAVLFTHTEAVTYEGIPLCGQKCATASFASFDENGSPVAP